MRGGDGASTDVLIAPRDASDGRVSGLVSSGFCSVSAASHCISDEHQAATCQLELWHTKAASC